ncbi:DUF2272 domain-containing protein [Fluviicola sp.]|uniref:DUF2272 domain-containing protein n=1 Tax=Fluviicola sp. TaxID=1917219 RepID=UPI0026154BB0|nr:DUF2272 domain-containing protein [Fluviicola sp.]
MKTSRVILISGVVILLSAGVAVALYFYFRDSFKKRLIRIAKGEAEKWKTLTETSEKASSYLLDYWKVVGFNFTASQMQNSAVQSSYAWSSAFISWLFYKAGAKDQFPYAQSHSGYFQSAKANRDNKNAPLRGFRVSEYAPKPGDLVVYSRENGKGYDSSGFFPSHGELVVETGKNYIKAIGGNVSNKVKVSSYKTDENGKLSGNKVPFFMVIQNNIK